MHSNVNGRIALYGIWWRENGPAFFLRIYDTMVSCEIALNCSQFRRRMRVYKIFLLLEKSVQVPKSYSPIAQNIRWNEALWAILRHRMKMLRNNKWAVSRNSVSSLPPYWSDFPPKWASVSTADYTRSISQISSLLHCSDRRESERNKENKQLYSRK